MERSLSENKVQGQKVTDSTKCFIVALGFLTKNIVFYMICFFISASIRKRSIHICPVVREPMTTYQNICSFLYLSLISAVFASFSTLDINFRYLQQLYRGNNFRSSGFSSSKKCEVFNPSTPPPLWIRG